MILLKNQSPRKVTFIFGQKNENRIEDNFVILFKEMYRINPSIILNPMSFTVGTKKSYLQAKEGRSQPRPTQHPTTLENRCHFEEQVYGGEMGDK